MNLERVTIRLLVFPPKDFLPPPLPLPLYRNMTFPSRPFTLLKRCLLNTEEAKHWQFLRYFRQVQLLVMSSEAPSMAGAFQRSGGRGISSLRLSHPHCSICSFRFFSVPFISKAQRSSWSYTKGCWRWVISTASFIWLKLMPSSDAWTCASSGSL